MSGDIKQNSETSSLKELNRIIGNKSIKQYFRDSQKDWG